MLAALQSALASMDPDNDQAGYKKWRFDATCEASRSTLWRRKKLKRKLEYHNNEDNEICQPPRDDLMRKLECHNNEDKSCENEICQPHRNLQDRDECAHGSDSEMVLQAIQSDDDFSCLGKHQ